MPASTTGARGGRCRARPRIGACRLAEWRVPTVCPRCEMLAATAHGCRACGEANVIPTRVTFVVTGASGSGKTVVAHHLHSSLPGAVVADADNFLGVAEYGFEAFCNVLLEFAFTVIQGNRTPVLCGTLMPERLNVAPARDLLGTIRYINLDCSDDVRTQRLRDRPAWRESSSVEVIERHLAFAAHLRERDDMVTIDATALSPIEAAQAVASFVASIADVPD